MSIFQIIARIFSSTSTTKAVTRSAGRGHHARAISQGLRKGSSECGKVMAKWRWK